MRTTRRRFIQTAGVSGLAAITRPGLAQGDKPAKDKKQALAILGDATTASGSTPRTGPFVGWPKRSSKRTRRLSTSRSRPRAKCRS